MLRPRLSHPLWVILAIVSCLVASLAYFPFTRIMAGPSAQVLPSAGKPLVYLKAPQAVSVSYAGSHGVASALQSGSPTAMAMADFDEDGAMDLATGYRTAGGGAIALMHGNPDALAPKDTSLYAKAMRGNVPPTFQSKAAVFALPVSPDFMATGDFDRDGHKDLLVAARGGALYFLKGDGKGNLAKPQLVQLLGSVTALAPIADGHVAVGTDGAGGPQVVILAPGASGLTASETFPLTASASSMAWGALGQHTGPDLAVASGDNIVVIYHAFHDDAQTETVNVPFTVHALSVGDFIWDRDGRTEIALLAEDGSIHILQHGILDTTPFTAAELKAHGALRAPAKRGATAKPQPNATGAGPWTLAKKLSASVAATSGAGRSMMQSPRLTGAADLLVVDAAKNQLKIVDGTGKAASPETDIAFSSLPVAAAVMPQKLNGKRDLVVMTAGQTTPTIISEDSGGIDPTVNTTADTDAQNACNDTSVLAGGLTGTISLRTALCAASNTYNAGTTSLVTVTLPPDTYSLTSLDTGELQVGYNGANVALVGTGTPANTIIQQTDGVDRVFDFDPNATGANTESISNVTIEDGTNQDNNDFADDGAGGMIDGSGNSASGDTLTLTNVVLTNNTDDGASASFGGGGLGFEGVGSLTVTNSTISNNTASEETGGGIETGNEDPSEGDTFSFTGSTFTGNVSTKDGTVAGEGGGLLLATAEGSSATISNCTFTNNTAQDATNLGEGGAINNTGALTISNSRIAGNHASDGSGLIDFDTAITATDNWWGCNGGPNTTGCDTVVAPSGTPQGSVNFTPWLVLGITPTSTSPAQILPGGTTTLTADLTHNSSGTGGFSVPNGTPVSFGASLGTDNPTSTTLTSGQATSTYTAGSTAGNDTATATVDSQTVPASANINILDTVTVTTSPGSLTITVDGTTYTAPQTFNWVVGSSHTLNTTSPQNVSGGSEQVWSSWSQGGPQSQTVAAPTAETTYTANFTTEYQLTMVASPSADGTVTPASGNYFAGGASIPVTATANAGFQFTNWTSTGGSFGSTTTASTNFTMPSAATTVTGNFVPATVQITITTSPANLLVSADGGPLTAAPLVETWNIGSSHTIATTSPQSGGTGVQYVWSSWSDSGAISHSITVPSTANTYTASFNTQYQLTTAANPTNGGTVSPTSGGFYNSGTSVPLTATANAGFAFSSWTGNVASATSASTTITMTAPQSVTANFTATRPMVNLKPASVNFGTVHLSSTHSENVTVTNVGSGTLIFKSVSLTEAAGNPDSFTFLNSCGSTLAPTKSCTITIGFAANKIGSNSATLNIADNAASSPQHVPLSATVINPRASLNPQSVNFGTHKVDSSTVKNVTLTNNGTTTLDIISIAITGADQSDFSQMNTCPSSLGAGKKCTISVTFDPQTTGARSAGLTVTDNALASSETVSLSGTGD